MPYGATHYHNLDLDPTGRRTTVPRAREILSIRIHYMKYLMSHVPQFKFFGGPESPVHLKMTRVCVRLRLRKARVKRFFRNIQ